MENNYFKLFLDDLTKLWNGLDAGQKFGIIALSAVTLVISGFFIMKSMEPNWSVLYSDLSPQDAAAVSESLKKSGYAYKLSQDKRSVLVPQELQDELRIYVAENDLIVDFVGEMIQARKKNNISQRDLENISGIKQSVIGRMESGKTDPKLSTVMKLLNALGKTLAIVPIDKTKKQTI